jgi:peptidoglycan/LPS O-acetylase OafA/YrhL
MQLSSASLCLFVVSIFAVAIVVSYGTTEVSVFYRDQLDAEVTATRYHAIDGLRGLLALSVMLHHIMINLQFYQTGVWDLPPSRLTTFLGCGGVAFFFMITAFLFWNQVSRRDRPFDTRSFYISRIRRLVPMYLVAVSLLILTVIAITHFRLSIPPLVFFQQLTSWLIFTAPGAPDINGVEKTFVINGVFWSLVYEWKFYLFLPLLAVLKTQTARISALLVTCAYLTLPSTVGVQWFFVSGVIAATIVRAHKVSSIAQHWLSGVVALLFIAATIAWQPECYSVIGAALLFLPFIVFASGNSLFGLLTSPLTRLLGIVSYSVYLTHSWVLYLLSRLVNHYVSIASLTLTEYWALGAAVCVTTIGISVLTYRYIEHPFLLRRTWPTQPRCQHVETALGHSSQQ